MVVIVERLAALNLRTSGKKEIRLTPKRVILPIVIEMPVLDRDLSGDNELLSLASGQGMFLALFSNIESVVFAR